MTTPERKIFIHDIVIPLCWAVVISVVIFFTNYSIVNADPLSSSSLFNISSIDTNSASDIKITKKLISKGFDYSLDVNKDYKSSSQIFDLVGILGLTFPDSSSDCKQPVKDEELFPGEKYFSSHEDNFVGFSKDGESFEGHFQLSLRSKVYTLFKNTVPTSLYIAYTQIIVSDLSADSIPITEINLTPEIFLMFQSPSNSGFKLDRILLGFLHESNGVGEPTDESSDTLSRSWDNYYIEVTGAYVWDKKTYIKTNFRYWEPIDSLGDNPDIMDYYGNKRSTWSISYNDYSLSYMIQNKIQKLTLYFNFIDDFEPNLFFQVHKGPGFTLNNYNKSDDLRYRIGISL